MSLKFTYWSDLNGTQLNDSTQQWVHALPIGEYEHPMYGKLSFDADRIRRFAQSVKDRVRGIDPDIDYDHKMDPSKGNTAAGWVKDAEERSDGLWLLVEWTNKALQALQDREYRYFSAEFTDEWTDPEGNVFKDVILGGGLTNRPFLKNLVPINLSELTEAPNQEDKMDRAELARILGLSEEATEDDIKAKLNELNDGSAELDLSSLNVSVNENGEIVVSKGDKTASFSVDLPTPSKEEDSAEDKELAKLAESNPAIAKILSENKAMQENIKEIQATQRLSEVTTQLSDLGSDSKVALPPVAQDKFRTVMVKLPKALSDDIADALKELLKVGIVKLGETTPSSKDGSKPVDDNVIAKFFAEVDRIKKEAKDNGKTLTTREASDIVRQENPVLFSEYVRAVDEGQKLTELEA